MDEFGELLPPFIPNRLPPLYLIPIYYTLSLLMRLRIDHGNGDHVHDLAHGAAQLQYVHRLFHPYKDRTYGFGPTQLLVELEGNLPAARFGKIRVFTFLSASSENGKSSLSRS